MLPTALTFHNYRSFAGPQRLELRPLTLLFGENNAGKSALLRSLPLLADSAAAEGLDALGVGARFRDLDIDFDNLRWKGRAETDEHTIGIELHWQGDPTLEAARFALWEQPDWPRVVVQQLSLTRGDAVVDFEWIPRPDSERSHVLPYRRMSPMVESETVTLGFHGLVPAVSQEGMSREGDFALFSAVKRRLAYLASQVVWLRCLRPAPQRTSRWSDRVRWELAPSGIDAAFVLAAEPEVREPVSDWYSKHLGLELKIQEPRKREVRVVLRGKYEAAFDVDMIDTGEGLSQVMPVLTALAMADVGGSRRGPSIVAIEEPEAHLHPTLQRALAERVCEVVARAQPRVVLETHSNHFLLAVQHAVLSGVIAERDVIMYWVRQLEDGRSVAEPTTLTGLARLRGPWPTDAFEADLELAAEIQDLRDQQEGG